MPERENRKFGVSEQSFALKLNRTITIQNFDRLSNKFIHEISQFLQNAIQRLQATPEDEIRLELVDEQNRVHTSTRYMRIQDFDPTQLLQLIESGLQSYQMIENGARITIHLIKTTQGGARNKAPATLEELKNRKCIINVNGNKHDCFAQCLAIGIALFQKKFNNDPKMYNKLTGNNKYKDRYREQEAKRLYEIANRPYYENDIQKNQIRLDEIPQFENALNVSINVYNFYQKTFLWKTSNKRYINLFLLYSNNHYDLITTMAPIMGNEFFCDTCYKAQYREKHKCSEKLQCLACLSETCEGKGKTWKDFTYQCEECKLQFYDEACSESHLDKCKSKIKCLNCKRIYNPKKEEHKCGYTKCQNCKEYILPRDHKCFHTKDELIEPSTKIIVYDVETETTGFKHEILCVCAYYPYQEIESIPQGAELRRGVLVFKKLDDFGHWLFGTQHKNYKVFAHNGGRYDLHFIRDYMTRCEVPVKGQTASGSKFISLTTTNLKFLDSYNIISIPLSKFPETFDIKELKKGYFPYTFVNKNNLNENYPKHPHMRYYSMERKKEKELADFQKWYHQNKDKPFDCWT